MTAPVTLATLLMEHPFADDEPLLFGPASTLTAGEARREAERIAAGLRASEAQPGTAVAVQVPDSPSLIATMFGIRLAGAVFVPINPRYPAAEVEKVVAGTAPVALITRDGDCQELCVSGVI